MRCYDLSDLHLETETFPLTLPGGDVLIIAGDLCHARALDPMRSDRYAIAQRGRVLRFIDDALAKFAHILMIAGNHEPYDGVLEDTTRLLRTNLPGVTVLDNESIELGGVRFFGTTLWTDLSGRSDAEMTALRRGLGEYFFVKTRATRDGDVLTKLAPHDTHREHKRAWASLRQAIGQAPSRPTVVITHHAPSYLGLNPRFRGNGLDAAYASSRDSEIATFENVPVWVHGHTHIAKTYRIGGTIVRTNARGFVSKGQGVLDFSVKSHFEIG